LSTIKGNHSLMHFNLRTLKIEDAGDRQMKKEIKQKLRANRGFARVRRERRNPKMKYIHYCAMIGDKQGVEAELKADDSLK